MKNTSRTPYIYKVTNLETGQYYIGSQCSGKTIGHNYFTSSTNKEFWEDFKTYGEEKYKITIVKAFGDPDECVHAENYMIRDHMQLKDGLCLNRAYFCGDEKVFSRVGTHHSEETRKRISETLKGRPLSEETKKKMSMFKKGHPVWNKGIPSWNKGIHHTEEAKQKISKAKKIKISIENEVLDSITEASKYYNMSIPTIRYWLKNKKHNAFYVEK